MRCGEESRSLLPGTALGVKRLAESVLGSTVIMGSFPEGTTGLGSTQRSCQHLTGIAQEDGVKGIPDGW